MSLAPKKHVGGILEVQALVRLGSDCGSVKVRDPSWRDMDLTIELRRKNTGRKCHRQGRIYGGDENKSCRRLK